MIHIPSNKKIVIFSDTHLSHVFNQKLFDMIMQIISSADIVVINGDFWDSSKTSFKQFITSEWSKLFPYLKKRNTIYIYGNHDLQHESDTRVTLFSDSQAESIVIYTGNQTYHIHHGHWLLPITAKLVRLFAYHQKLLARITLPLDVFMHINQFLIKRNITIYTSINNGFISYKKKNIPSHHLLVTGHTHTPQIVQHYNFINLGYTHKGFASWIEIHNGNFTFNKKVFD